MPRRRRWTPVRGTASRVYDPFERALLGLLDAPGRLLLGAPRPCAPPDPASIRDVLVLRLDRIGDVLMSLPALHALRAALPGARLRLAVGRWSEGVARSAHVDEVLVWSAPWVGRPAEGAETVLALAGKARALAARPPDLAIDLQGDLRASLLLWLTRARRRVGYANTGGAYLLTDVVPLDETVSWVEQNRLAVGVALGRAPEPVPFDPLSGPEREAARRLLAEHGLESRSPLVGLHPSGGRRLKQWPVERWAEVAGRLQRELQALVVITGSAADRPLARSLAQRLPVSPLDLAGRLSVRETLALVSQLHLFLSPDTGPMHMACAVGTPSVSVFGPSDPARYFSGAGPRHAVVRPELWCSPCNLIRRPPRECAAAQTPECLSLVGAEEVYREAARLLREARLFAAGPA